MVLNNDNGDCVALIMSLYKNDKISYVKKSLESVLNQSYGNMHIYIIYDGLIDDKLNLYIEEIKNQNVFVLKRNVNKGLAYSLNELLLIVIEKKYRYIARMDSDDISYFNRIELQVNFLENNKNVDIVGTYIEEINESEDVLKKIEFPLTHNSMRNFFGKRNPLAHPTVMFRDTFFKKAGLYPINTNKDEDTVLWLNGFMSNCVFANIPEILLKFRIDNDFYIRRSGFEKSIPDFANRVKIINKLQLKRRYYILAFFKMLVFSLKSKKVLKFIYNIVR